MAWVTGNGVGKYFPIMAKNSPQQIYLLDRFIQEGGKIMLNAQRAANQARAKQVIPGL